MFFVLLIINDGGLEDISARRKSILLGNALTP
jgi:hypothetical protein